MHPGEQHSSGQTPSDPKECPPDPSTALPSPEARGVAAHAFLRLLETGAPVAAADLAASADLSGATVERALGEAASASRLRVLPDGRVHGAHGLDVLETRHALFVERTRGRPSSPPVRIQAPSRPRYTWCSFDVLGIMAALGATGHATSTSPWSGAALRLRFEGGWPATARAVLFLADGLGAVRPEAWCPSVNFFEDSEAARAWSEASGITGRVVSLEEGAQLGASRWGELLDSLGSQRS